MFDFIYAARSRRGITLVIFAALVVGAVLVTLWVTRDAAVAPEEVAKTTSVVVKSVNDIARKSTFEAVGTVEAVSEAKLQAEAGGRITSVGAQIGDTVRAGSVLATIENRNESAALLQAQGAYEAAQAGAASGNVSVAQAESGYTAALNAAVSANRSAYTTVSAAFYTNLNAVLDDTYITSPGVVLVGSELPFVKSEGRAFEEVLPRWQTNASTLSVSGDVDAALSQSKADTQRAIALVDALIRIFNDANPERIVADSTVAVQIVKLSTLRSSLNGTLAALEGAQVGLKNARGVKAQAALGGTNTELSAANAQVKIALGSLRAAQANYEKTIVRSPIAGVVNALYVKAGDYVVPGQAVAIVANNNGLEIATSVSLENSQVLAVGDTVAIDKNSSGIITAIAGAIDPTTGKVALKVSVNEGSQLENGATVSLAFSQTTQTTDVAADISVPLSALKMTGSGPVVFFVTPEGTLAAQPVVLGAIRGDSVVIASGITALDSIVVDARGLKDGQAVTVVTN